MNLNELAAEVKRDHERHEWWPKDNPVSRLPEALIFLVTEVAEIAEEYRDGHAPTEERYSWELPRSYPFQVSFDDGRYALTAHRTGAVLVLKLEEFMDSLRTHRIPIKPEGIPSELADVIIRALDIAAHLDIDIEKAVAEKMAYNRTRPKRHGRVV